MVMRTKRRMKQPRPNHLLHPLRRIEGYDKQNGVKVTKLICKHSAVGWPQDKRTARFFPCPLCFQQLEQHRRIFRTTGGLARTAKRKGK